MKKCIALLVICFMMVSLLAGCGFSPSPKDSVPTTTAATTGTVRQSTQTTTSSAVSVGSTTSTGTTTEATKQTTKKKKARELPPVTENPKTEPTKKTTKNQNIPARTHTTQSGVTRLTQFKPVPIDRKEKATTTRSFDVEYYVNFAKNLARDMGYMVIPDECVMGSYDTPIRAHAGCIYLERDLTSRLNFYKKTEPDVTVVWVWSEKIADGIYDIYVGRG